MVTCPYVTALDRPCRRLCAGAFCDFHALLDQLDKYDFRNPTLIYVPASYRPLVDRILSDFVTNLEHTI